MRPLLQRRHMRNATAIDALFCRRKSRDVIAGDTLLSLGSERSVTRHHSKRSVPVAVKGRAGNNVVGGRL
jgi:hypothetical protein